MGNIDLIQDKGYFEGMGHFKSASGDSYIGQFKRNKFDGKVTFIKIRDN